MSARPLRVLHVVPTFYPAFYWGGPIFSLYELCNHLCPLPEIQIRVLTTDSSGPAPTDRLSDAQRSPAQFEGYEVMFCRKTAGSDFSMPLIARLRTSIAWADVVHLTGVYSSPTLPTIFIARMLGKPVVWSPRGALQRWGGSRSALRKRLWDGACTLLQDRSRTVLHVTSSEEQQESNARMRGLDSVVIPNGVDVPDELAPREWRPGMLTRLAYLGRLDPKKGIENLLQAMAALEPDRYRLTIHGSGDRAYVDQLTEQARALQLAGQVRFAGAVSGPEKERAFAESDLLVVPSHTENFARVVAEALAHGVPVVASTGTPWSGIEQHGAGRWVANDPAALVAAIRSLEGKDLAQMGRLGRGWMRADYHWSDVAGRMAELYRSLAPGSKMRPAAEPPAVGLRGEGRQ